MKTVRENRPSLPNPPHGRQKEPAGGHGEYRAVHQIKYTPKARNDLAGILNAGVTLKARLDKDSGDMDRAIARADPHVKRRSYEPKMSIRRPQKGGLTQRILNRDGQFQTVSLFAFGTPPRPTFCAYAP